MNELLAHIRAEVEELHAARVEFGVTDDEWRAMIVAAMASYLPTVCFMRAVLNDRDRRWHQP